MVRFVSLCCLGALLFDLTGCRGHSSALEKMSTRAKTSTPAKASVEAYVSDSHSVGFDISPLHGYNGSRLWLATYSDQGKTAKFTIELKPPLPMVSEAGGAIKISSGSGAIVAMADSDASTMLIALAKALEAKHVPAHAQRGSRLPFSYVILGENDSQASEGGFSAQPPGNWTAMKIFIADGDDDSEVFLNFNTVSQKAQFSEKDVDYGDTVLAKLATVL